MNLTSIFSNNIAEEEDDEEEEAEAEEEEEEEEERGRGEEEEETLERRSRRRIRIIEGEEEEEEEEEQEIEAEEQEEENDTSTTYYETNYITDQLSSFNLSNNTRIDYLSWEEGRRTGQGSCAEEVVGVSGIRLSSEGGEGQGQRLGAGGMPRSKRRAPSSTNHHHHHHSGAEMPPSAHEEGMPRHPTKRLRHTSSARRYTKTEDVSSASSYSQKRCVAWFREYTTPDDPDTLGPEGMEKFCEDIGVEPENVVMLVLAYKMNARQMGFFTLNEWLKGLSEMQCDSIAKVQQKLEHLRNQLNEPHTFKGIYRYAYDFARDKDQRSMDMETARVMLQLLLGKHWPLFAQFAQFLDQSKYKVINKDQWCNILEFSRTISHDLSNYDLDGAWPVMLDEFVEWLKVQRGEGGSVTSVETRGS